MTKRIKRKAIILGCLFLLTPLLILSSCSATDNKDTTPKITKKVEVNTTKVVTSNTTKKHTVKPTTPVTNITTSDSARPVLVTPIKKELIEAQVIEWGWNKLESVTKEMFQEKIPGITHIGAGAFYNNSSLTLIDIPDSVISIGEGAFFKASLTSIKIPSNVVSIRQSAFASNPLTSLEIPNSVVSIGESAFDGCPITTLSLGSSLTTIGLQAFDGNQILDNTLIIPDSVTSIDDYAFLSDSGYLKVAKLPDKFNTAEERDRIGVML